MSRIHKTTFGVHAIVALVLGIPMLVAPGKLLTWLGWAPIDPIISRLLGAASLALAWSSYRGWRAADWSRVAYLVEMELVFTTLACVALLRHVIRGQWPFVVWALLAIFALFAVAWAFSLGRPGKD